MVHVIRIWRTARTKALERLAGRSGAHLDAAVAAKSIASG